MTGGQAAALAGLGAFHGLNPGMGWLFAVAIGLQERSRTALLRAFGPIGLGHLASITVVAVAVTAGASATTARIAAIAGGVLLVGVGLWHLLSRRHFRWVGMRLTPLQLAGWSFLMASVHGAGLMLVPVLTPASDMHMAHMDMPGMGASVWDAILAALVHTGAMIAVAATIGFVIYEFVGLTILRSAWLNLDKVWAVALLGAGSATLVAAMNT